MTRSIPLDLGVFRRFSFQKKDTFQDPIVLPNEPKGAIVFTFAANA